MAATLAVTFDVDWAPDWAVAHCADLCRAAKAPATFFATHRSDILDDLARDPLFEIGLHPNFLAGSSHGDHPEAVMGFCLDLVPDARAMRTHSLHQSSPLLAMVAERHPQITTDISLLLPLHPGLRPVQMWLGSPPRPLTRIPYFWEDALFAAHPNWAWDIGDLDFDGLAVFNFHPLWVALNLDNIPAYQNTKGLAGSVPLPLAPKAALQSMRNSREGAESFLTALLALGGHGMSTISTIADDYRETLS